jgi:hypothetical protein
MSKTEVLQCGDITVRAIRRGQHDFIGSFVCSLSLPSSCHQNSANHIRMDFARKNSFVQEHESTTCCHLLLLPRV